MSDADSTDTTALALVPNPAALAPKAIALSPVSAAPTVAIAPRAHQHAARRNAAKPKHKARRNAGPATQPQPRSRLARIVLPAKPTPVAKAVSVLESLTGAGAAALGGALAVKYGLHPDLVSIALTAVGGYVAFRSERGLTQRIAAGAASAAGSQWVLMRLAKPPAPPPAVALASTPKPSAPAQPQPQPPPQPPASQHRAADLGALPPGMLDAAFERARAELAVGGEGYPSDYSYPPHHFHHGPVMP